MAGMMDKVKAKVDQVMHKDKTHDETTGPHSSHTANTVDPRVDNTTGTTHTGTGHHGSTGVSTGLGTSGTHGERLSEHDNTTHGSTGLGSSTTGAGQYGETQGNTGFGSSTTDSYGSTAHSDPTGPHNSSIMNKADPRVDSDRYGTAGNTAGAGGVGAGQYGETQGRTGGFGSSTGAYESGNTTGAGGYGNTTGGLTGHGTNDYSDPSGPHNSRIANKADPRVDSDRYGAAGNTSGAGGFGAGQYGSSGNTGAGGYDNTTGGFGHGQNDPTGPHSSHMANQADPRVGGGIGSTGGYGSNTGNIGGTGSGYGDNTMGHTGTTGHHTQGKPSVKDKLNPKVDADNDGKAGIMD